MMGRKNKNCIKRQNNNLVKIVVLLPYNISAEEIARLLREARKICTQVVYHTLPGRPGKFEAWCTARQAHDFGNFTRQAFKAYSLDEGVDMDSLRSDVALQTKGYPLESFNLPTDAKRLNIRYGAAGSYAAIMDHPAYRNHEELLLIAHKMCDISPQLRPEVTNNLSLYRQIAVSAYLAGYQLGIALLNGMSKEEQVIFTNRLVDDDRREKGPLIIAFFAERLKQQMNDQNVETVEALL